jgi:microcystin-dependent protein
MTSLSPHGLIVPAAGDFVTELRMAIAENATRLRSAVLYSEGAINDRGAAGIAGRLFRSTDEIPSQLYLDTGAAWRVLPADGWTVGDKKTSLQSADHAPLGGGLYLWLLGDGRELDVGYTTLITLLAGNPFGVGANGRPRLPDHRGRVDVMPDGTAGRLVGGALGEAAGEEKHTLTIAEMPSHTHGLGFTAAGPNYGGVMNNNTDGSIQSTTHETGGGSAHDNMQPYLVGGNVFVRAW